MPGLRKSNDFMDGHYLWYLDKDLSSSQIFLQFDDKFKIPEPIVVIQ